MGGSIGGGISGGVGIIYNTFYKYYNFKKINLNDSEIVYPLTFIYIIQLSYHYF